MKRQLLLLSNSTNAGEDYLLWCKDLIAQFCQERKIKQVLFIPYAGVSIGYDAYAKKVADVLANYQIELHSIHESKDVLAQVEQAQCIIIGGGNTFFLVHELHRLGLMEAISKRAQEGLPLIGWSAGSNVACPSMKTTNDMPIIEPASFSCLNLIPFQINPHYLDAHPQGHGGETREDRLKEFMIINPEIYIVGLREACALLIQDQKIELIGDRMLRVFHHGIQTKEYSKQDNIQFLLG